MACIAAVGGGQRRSSDTAGYDATAHHSINPGPAPPAFAGCTAAVNSDIPVSCTAAHTAEQLGVMVSAGSVTEQDRRGCRALARRLTGIPDITASGRLAATTVDTGGAGDGQHSLECWMVAVSPHQLTGPLLGLSNRPVPIT